MSPTPPGQGPIFVIGSGRSGTTLLRMMLCAHPRIYITHEAYFYPWAALTPRRDGEDFVEGYLRSFGFRWLRLAPETFLHEVPRDLTRERGYVLFEAVMRAKAAQHGKARFGDKTPPHSGHLARIFRDFPDACVVRIIRDPRAVAQSLSRMPWSSGTTLFGAWINEVERRQVAPFRDRILQVRLEDLLARPRDVMGEVLDFVGEPWDDRVLDHVAHGPGADDLPPLPWFSAAAESRAASGPPAWMHWSPATVRMVERITRASMEEGGYAPAALDVEPPLTDVLAAAARETPAMMRDLTVLARLVQASRDPVEQIETRAQKALFRSLNPAAWDRIPGFTMPDPPLLPGDWARAWGRRSPPPSQARMLLTPLYAGSIWAEGQLTATAQGLALPFPRGLPEIDAHPERLFTLLQRAGAIPKRDTLVEVRRRRKMANEPDKDRTAAVLDVVSRDGDATTVTPVFVKFQSGRGMPILLQAVRAAVEPGIAREVEFYRRLAGEVPLRVAKPYVAESLTAFNRVCIALEYVEGYNPADWRGCPLAGVRAMLKDVAKMNAAFVSRTASDARTQWIPAREGLQYASFVVTLAGDAPDWYMALWKALAKFFKPRPVTLVHGDCRPGNMLFLDDGTLARHVRPESANTPDAWPDASSTPPTVVFGDWEAVNAAPLLWDFTYCTIIGLRSVDRRAHQPRLLDEFLGALREGGVAPAYTDLARARLEVDLLTMVLYYVAALVVSKGYWDNQGNTLEDYRAWSDRILDALHAVDVGRAATALGVDPELIRRLQREASFKERSATPRAPLATVQPAEVAALLDGKGDAGWAEIVARFGRVFRYQGGVVTCEPDDLQTILTRRAHTVHRPAPHRFADRVVPGAAGILFKEGDAWKQRLKPLMTGFNPQAVAAGEARVRAVVDDYLRGWRGGRAGADLFAEVTALGLRIALVTGYNLDPDDRHVHEFGETLVAYKASTMNPDARRRLDEFSLDWRKARDLPRVSLAFYEFHRHVRRLDSLVREIARRRPWADPTREGWFQSLTGAGLEGAALTNELNHLYGAFTAADYTTACALGELAHAPEWTDKLRGDDADRAATLVLKETSRRYPVAMVIYRELGEPMDLGGETFPAGTLVMALPYALHHDPAWWERPTEFDPGRWERGVGERAEAAYEPFLKGPRRCIGQDFAQQQMRVVLTSIFRRFTLETDRRPRVNSYIIPRLATPISFRFRPLYT